ncbi:zinc finger, CCHC-type containing protein [Tanacetum coccineum]
MAFLYQALPEEQLLQITKYKTAKTIWDALKTRHIGEERIQQARLQTLKSDFEMLHMKEDETIDTFTTKLTTLVNKAASLGHTMEDETLVRKLLNVVPDRYLQIVASIEQYSDLSEMTLEEAIGRLKTYEERIKYKKGKQVDNQEKLMFTRHENKGKYFRGRGRGKHRFSQERNHENFKGERKDGETSHRSYNKNNFKKSNYDTSKLRCYKCKEIGHIAPKCPQKTKSNEQSNLVEEDLEPTLLMAILEDEEEQNVSLHEEDVGYKETNKDSLWYLDNGVSNHMIRCMMKATNLPQNFWAEAVRHAIYILNSVPIKALEDITPYEAIKQRKPNLENLRVFGCIAYAKVPSQHLTKLDDRSTRMVYLGNEQGSKAYRLFDPTTQRI